VRVRALTSTGDYAFGQGAANYLVNTPQAVGQLVQTTLLLWQGEWFLDTLAGTPWLQSILGVFSLKSVVDMILQGVITSVDGVTKIVSYSSTYVGVRNLAILCTIETAFSVNDVSTVTVSVQL
jgi:hypothetical protein